MMNYCGERLVVSRLCFVFVFLIVERSVAVIVVPMLQPLRKHGLPLALRTGAWRLRLCSVAPQ